MEIFILVYTVLLGLAIGSFLNVLIYRIPLKLSVSKGYSFCPCCSHKLKWTDLFPVLSFIYLKGRCRYCNKKISIRYPLIEVMNTLAYLLIYLTYGFTLISVIYAVVASSLITLSMIDIDTKIIPDRFNAIIGICALICIFIYKDIGLTDRLIGFFAVSVPVLIIAMISGGMGEGDIKLFSVCGLLLGWQNIVLSFILASVMAAVFGIILIIRKKATGKTEMPFGPFIAAAVGITMIYGGNIIRFYISIIR